MINCQITRDGKTERNVTQDGLTFLDNHGMERSNRIESDALEVSLQEWHYQKFGIMNQHYLGKKNNIQFIARHEVRPALMFSMTTLGGSMKEVYGKQGGASKEMVWKAGQASLCFLNGEGGANTHLNRGTQFEIFNVVIPQQYIEELINRNLEAFEPLFPLTSPIFDTQTIIKYNQPAEASVAKAARDIQRSRLLGNQAPKYMESKIIDCLSGFLLPGSLSSGQAVSLILRDKIHDAKDIILSHYQDMPSLHELARMVGTNECTLKKVFKLEFGTTVFQFLYDHRMELAAHYLLDTSLPVSTIGIKLGYDYQSHFCTAFKRKFGVSPMEFRLRRGELFP